MLYTSRLKLFDRSKRGFFHFRVKGTLEAYCKKREKSQLNLTEKCFRLISDDVKMAYETQLHLAFLHRSYPVSPVESYPVQSGMGTGNPTHTRTRNRGILRSLFCSCNYTG